MSRERQICFTDSGGKELFFIPDGSFIKMVYGNGDEHFALCRYLDEAHAKIDGVDYSIQEFSQRMESNGISYAAA